MADGEADDPLSQLMAKHKREKKELQGKIVAMKKAVAKTDKKKHRELNKQSEEMEKELQTRHDQELSALRDTVQAPAGGGDSADGVTSSLQQLTVDSPPPPSRVTKAQRRRDKKAEKEREREERIAEQEELNRLGPRHLETETIKERLLERGLMIREVPSDGDCMYAAVVDQLGGSRSVSDLRKLTSDQLLAAPDQYLPFLTDPATGDMLTDEGYRHYCHLVATSPAWGGQTELAALSAALSRRVLVVQAEGPPVVLGEAHPGDPLVLTFHRHMYGLGEHYNSTKPAPPSTDDPQN